MAGTLAEIAPTAPERRRQRARAEVLPPNPLVQAFTIVLAAGSVPEKKLYDDISGKVPVVHLAGDCVEPGTIRAAIADGYRIGSVI